MWKRKISIKEQYGTLEHFLKGDEPCHYIGQRYIEGTNFYARREWRGVKDTAFAFYKWLCTWVKMAIFRHARSRAHRKGFLEIPLAVGISRRANDGR